MTKTLLDYFKAATTKKDPASSRESSNKRKALSEVVLLSSEDEGEAETGENAQKSLLLRSTKTSPAKKKGIRNDDSESETSSEALQVVICTETVAEQQLIINVNEESLRDSEELLTFKRKKFTRNNCISDSDDETEPENATNTADDASENEAQGTDGSSEVPYQVSEWSTDNEYSSDSYDSDADNEPDTDEEERINNYRDPDPRYLYEDVDRRKKSKTKKEASYDDNQEVSIHKIKLNHHELSGKSVEKVIKFIVDKYNKGKESSRAESKNIFKKMTIQREPVVKPEDEKHFKGDPFLVKVFVQKVARNVSLLHSYGIKEKATTIHSLIFHYRKNELFAITTNQSWNVVQWCSDFEFPGIIAARILSKDGELQSTDKGLVGTELTRKTTHKQQKKTNPYDLLRLCTRYTAELRANASILRLSCFQKTNTISENGDDDNNEYGNRHEAVVQSNKSLNTTKRAKVTVSLGNIRILKRLSTSDILSILSLFSAISNGEQTVNLDFEIEENSSAHKKYLTAVHTEISNELNGCLSEIIHDAIVDDNRMAELDNYQFCHKHSSDFFSGYDFKLLYKGNTVKEFSEIPTIKQIVVELRQNLGQISAGTSRLGFLQLLNNAKISYRFGTKNGEKKPEKLLNFIDGLLCHSRDNSVFWHVKGMWCHVQDGYIHLVHDQFKKILTNYLLTDESDPAYLQIYWPNNENMSPEAKLKNYLENYTNFQDAWSSEQPERDIVDMIKIGKDNGKNVFFVYYFLPGLNHQTNIKCNRIAESIMQIGKADMTRRNQNGDDDVAGSEHVRKQLEIVYRKLSHKRQFKVICPNSNKFLKMMTEAKFYLAIGRDASTASSIDVPSLVKEKEMRTYIASRDIADILENLINSKRNDDMKMLKHTTTTMLNEQFNKCISLRLADSIHHQLSQQEYIEADGNTIRGKLLSITRNNFKITSNECVNQFLYDKIISKFQSRACTVLSKLGFIDFREEISKLTITSFHLVEIPIQD